MFLTSLKGVWQSKTRGMLILCLSTTRFHSFALSQEPTNTLLGLSPAGCAQHLPDLLWSHTSPLPSSLRNSCSQPQPRTLLVDPRDCRVMGHGNITPSHPLPPTPLLQAAGTTAKDSKAFSFPAQHPAGSHNAGLELSKPRQRRWPKKPLFLAQSLVPID